jgi:hypothetical protein
LDNRRCNLRIVTKAINQRNLTRHRKDNVHSGVRGVAYHPRPGRRKRWQGRATVNGKRFSLGYYSTIAEAESVVVAWRLKNMPGAVS